MKNKNNRSKYNTKKKNYNFIYVHTKILIKVNIQTMK